MLDLYLDRLSFLTIRYPRLSSVVTAVIGCSIAAAGSVLITLLTRPICS